MTDDQASRGFDPEALLRTLSDHHVEFVLIGGLAATLYGSPFVTTDVDVTPKRGRPNLERLSEALRELDARVRVDGIPEGLVFDPAASALERVSILNLTTRFGDLDLTFEPAGFSGYSDLEPNALRLDVHGTPVVVAALSDVIRSKEAAGRAKDHLTLPTLRTLRDRLEGDE